MGRKLRERMALPSAGRAAWVWPRPISGEVAGREAAAQPIPNGAARDIQALSDHAGREATCPERKSFVYVAGGMGHGPNLVRGSDTQPANCCRSAGERI